VAEMRRQKGTGNEALAERYEEIGVVREKGC
jgi:hypothetical protein